MTPRHILNTLSAILRSDNPQTVHLYGPPGCGKTALCSQAAKATRLQALIIALPTCEAVDLRGMPQIVNGRTSWASPLPRDGEGVLVLDEVSTPLLMFRWPHTTSLGERLGAICACLPAGES